MKKPAIAALTISLVVGIACGLAWLCSITGQNLFGMPTLLLLAGIAFAVQWLAFIPAYLYQTEHFYDLIGSLTYLTLVVLALMQSATTALDPRDFLLSGLITVWALRLGSFLFLRVQQTGKDGRFDQIKPQAPRFLIAWTLQGLWVFITLLAALISISNSATISLGVWAIFGGLVWCLGFAIEVIADRQKSRFRKNPENAGSFIKSGLWRWSRHPNYFGEILLWVGICIIAAPSFVGWQWLGLISPVFVALLIIKVSGVPLLEKRADEKWGDNEIYQDYKRRTPSLMLWPPSRQ